MKNPNIHLLVCDWNPNGTNDLMIAIDGDIYKHGLDEVTFGIDINRHGPFELEPGLFVASVPLKTIVDCLAISPVRSRAESYQRLMQFINDSTHTERKESI
jgi:hypothetical protein